MDALAQVAIGVGGDAQHPHAGAPDGVAPIKLELAEIGGVPCGVGEQTRERPHSELD